MSKNTIKMMPTTRPGYGIMSDNNGTDIKFYQPFSSELGIHVGSVVQYTILVLPSSERVAINVGTTAVNPQRNGIVIILDNDEGTISDQTYGTIGAYEPFFSQQGITNGAAVKYDVVQTSQGMVAVHIKLP